MQLSNEIILLAFGLTLFAGLSTGIGSILGFLSKNFNPKILALSLGFSAGVMIYVSFIEIFPKAREALGAVLDEKTAYGVTILAFFGGVFLIAIIDKLIPLGENPHEISLAKQYCMLDERDAQNKKLMRMGLFSAIAITIHNFPEGLATFMGAISDPMLGFGIAVAIAIHNIPEGLAVSAPIYYATKSRKKAFWLSFASGLSEPVGAIIGFFLLRQFFSDFTFGIVFAGVAGIMVYISMDELLPTAEEYGEHHIAIAGLIGGMAVMALSLFMLV